MPRGCFGLPKAVLVNQNRYRITPRAGFDVLPFTRDFCTLQGDADNNGQVLAPDYFQVKNRLFELTDAPYDLDGSGLATSLHVALSLKPNSEQRRTVFEDRPKARVARRQRAAVARNGSSDRAMKRTSRQVARTDHRRRYSAESLSIIAAISSR